MPLSRDISRLVRFSTLLFLALFLCMPAHAQKKKKKKYKKKSDANLIARAYHDVTTRNNYYFNANLIFQDILTDIDLNYEADYQELLPLYYHQKLEDFTTYSSQLDEIIKKTSIVMHHHDNTRWKDNVYLLLGKARYMNGEYDDALKTFRFVVTTMEEEVGKTRGKVDNKAKLKAAKAKEAAKKAKERKKEIAKKRKEMKDALSKLKRDKEKSMASKNKKKKKALQKRVKAKKKIIALRKKGKKPSQKLLDLAYGRDEDEKEEEVVVEEEPKQEEEKEDDNIIVVKTDYRSDKKEQKRKEAEALNELALLNDTLPMTEKEIRQYDDLSFWEKIKHKVSRPEALVWMAKTYMKQGEMELAQAMLEYAEAMPKLTRKQREGVYAGQTYFYMENRRYVNAIESLERAATLAKKKKRGHYRFISAQLWEYMEDYGEARKTYQLIADGKADFTMKFYASMRQITLLDKIDSPEADAEAMELLTKLLKNGSNKEFRDQIHYQLAGLHLKRGEYAEAQEQLEASITTSRNNPLQKGLSFKQLAEIYLEQESYNVAGMFMDSAAALVPQDHELHSSINLRASSLNELIPHINVITTTDSLLLLSRLTDEELVAYVAEQERQARTESRKKRRGKGDDATDFIRNAVVVQSGQTMQSAEWYFYNPNLRTQGYTQFKLTWGERPLEDNWRRIDKAGSFDISAIANIDKSEEEIEAAANEVKVDYKIPRTDEEIASAHKDIANALYEAGKLMRNNLELNRSAATRLERLVTKYDDFPRVDRAYYYLYLIYTAQGNLARANHYKDIILDKYPVSQYANAINNPYEARPLNNDEETEPYRPRPAEVEVLYASTFNMFQNRQYENVIGQRKLAWDTYKESPLMPKFDFLEALSYGHLDSLAVLKHKLGTIIAKYPNHEVEQKAREYLAIINREEEKEGFEDTVVVANEIDTTAFVSIYSNEESDNIFGMIVVDGSGTDIRQLIQLVDQFNSGDFKARKLRVSNAYLDKDSPLILIKRFRSQEMASEYFDALSSTMETIFGAELAESLQPMLISNENFRTLFTTKKLDEYKQFFQQTYTP